MRTFKIDKPNETLRPAIQAKIDNLNKPKGSLGRLEELAMQICLVQQTLEPSLEHPCHLLLGGDHGIEREGVSVSPREVTWQQMINFTRGGGGVNMFCRQHGFKLRIVDVGVDYDLSSIPGIIDRKIDTNMSGSSQAAQHDTLFDQCNLNALSGRRDCRGDTRDAPADDDNIGFFHDWYFFFRNPDVLIHNSSLSCFYQLMVLIWHFLHAAYGLSGPLPADAAVSEIFYTAHSFSHPIQAARCGLSFQWYVR